MRLYHDNRSDHRVERKPLSDETKMGVVLLVVAFVALGAYTGVQFIGFLIKLLPF